MPTSATFSSPTRADRTHVYGARAVRGALAALTVVALPLAVGCYPDQITNSEDLDTVTTLFDSTSPFGTLRRYAIVDSVVTIPDSAEPVTAAFSTAVIAQIRQDLNARGWVEERSPQTHAPDVIVVAGAIKTSYVYADWYSYWGYWPYWPGGWPGWGWYYPVVYTYDVGSLVVQMVDVGRARRDTIPVAWVAAVRGVAEGAANNQARAVAGVNQAFEQSPYLQVTGTAITRR